MNFAKHDTPVSKLFVSYILLVYVAVCRLKHLSRTHYHEVEMYQVFLKPNNRSMPLPVNAQWRHQFSRLCPPILKGLVLASYGESKTFHTTPVLFHHALTLLLRIIGI